MRHAMISIGAAAALSFGAPALAQPQSLGEQQVRTVTAMGVVIDSRDLEAGTGDWRRLVKLQKSDGESVVVDLGPAAPRVTPGERLFVHGHRARVNGRPVIIARFAAQPRELAQRLEDGSASAGAGAQSGWYDDWWDDQIE